VPIRKSGVYIGAREAELKANRVADKAAGAVSQKALFRRRGTIALTDDALVLEAWGDNGDLVLKRENITATTRKYTDLYGRVIGGLLDSGKPLILDTATTGPIYLLIDRKEFMETTKNAAWHKAIVDWLGH
jgi:hypothetical protein